MGMKPRTKVEPPPLTTKVEPPPTSVEPAPLNMVEISVILLHTIIETMPPWYMAHLSSETQDALKRVRASMVKRGLLAKRRAGDEE